MDEIVLLSRQLSYKYLFSTTSYMKIRSILALILVAGLLWACETTDPLIRDAQISAQLMDYESALEYSEQALEADSSNALAHYYRGYALGGIAQETEPPSDRRPGYDEMREAMDSARSVGGVMERRPGELDEIDDYIVSLWAYEHNAGAQIMTDDSTRQATENPDQTAVDTLKPQSPSSPTVRSATSSSPRSTIRWAMWMKPSRCTRQQYRRWMSRLLMTTSFLSASTSWTGATKKPGIWPWKLLKPIRMSRFLRSFWPTPISKPVSQRKRLNF